MLLVKNVVKLNDENPQSIVTPTLSIVMVRRADVVIILLHPATHPTTILSLPNSFVGTLLSTLTYVSVCLILGLAVPVDSAT